MPVSGHGGPAESGKSLWSLCEAAALTREGQTVVYVSQENPLPEEARRLDRVRPEWSRFRFFHDQGFDLLLPDHVAALMEAAGGCRARRARHAERVLEWR